MNKKIIGAIVGSVSLAIVTSVGLGVYALSKTAKNNTQEENKPLNRDKNYEHVTISTYFDKSKIKQEIVKLDENNNEFKPILDKTKFQHNIESLVRNALSKIDRFKNSANNYKIVVSYQFTNKKSVALDVVWYIPKSNPYHYYDQFQISLNAN
jgi:hypothetical protein